MVKLSGSSLGSAAPRFLISEQRSLFSHPPIDFVRVEAGTATVMFDLNFGGGLWAEQCAVKNSNDSLQRTAWLRPFKFGAVIYELGFSLQEF